MSTKVHCIQLSLSITASSRPVCTPRKVRQEADSKGKDVSSYSIHFTWYPFMHPNPFCVPRNTTPFSHIKHEDIYWWSRTSKSQTDSIQANSVKTPRPSHQSELVESLFTRCRSSANIPFVRAHDFSKSFRWTIRFATLSRIWSKWCRIRWRSWGTRWSAERRCGMWACGFGNMMYLMTMMTMMSGWRESRWICWRRWSWCIRRVFYRS